MRWVHFCSWCMGFFIPCKAPQRVLVFQEDGSWVWASLLVGTSHNPMIDGSE